MACKPRQKGEISQIFTKGQVARHYLARLAEVGTVVHKTTVHKPDLLTPIQMGVSEDPAGFEATGN